MIAFLARDSIVANMLSVLYAVARPSVCLSVCHTGESAKTVEVRISFCGVSFIHKFKRIPAEQGRGGDNKQFSRFKRQYLKIGRRCVQGDY